MYLQRLSLNGFKSFAHATTLEFLPPTAGSRGITAIVGPNGSGKSCVVDAIRWVLGEQSMKLLRGKKSEDVIFAGTPKRPRLGVAEVTLHLNNEDHTAPIDYTELAVGRRVYRSGESEYLLNGTQVRREDIILLLAKSRIGQRTYSIIGQGMVDEFLLATPPQRKTFFDEAAGIRPAELKRDAALRKLAHAEENLRQGDALLQELTPRLRSLTRQVKRLERREEVEQELAALLAQTYGHRWHALADDLARAQEAWSTADAEREQQQQTLDTLLGKLQAMERAEGTATHDDPFLKLQREYETLMDRRQALRERMLAAKHAAAQTQAAVASLHATALLPDLDAVLAEFDALLATLGIITSLDDLQPTLLRLRDLHRRIAALRGRCSPDAAGATPSRELKEAEGALRAIEGTLTSVQGKMADLHAAERRKKGELFALQRQSRAEQLAVNAAAQHANDARIALARLEQQREDLQQEIIRNMGAQQNPGMLARPDTPPPSDAAERIVRLQREVAAIGTLDAETQQEYTTTKERVEFLEQQTADLRKSIHALARIVEELAAEIDRAFHVSFQTINEHFERYFRILFGGGHAKLALLREDVQDENEGEHTRKDDGIPDIPPPDRASNVTRTASSVVAGIDITATPPGKRIKNISMLSGGERALTAIALLCAIISSSRSPFVVLDEVDAALDEANSVRFAEILKDLSKESQFLVVTHNRYTMERAAAIFGVTMAGDGASKLLSMKLEDAEHVAA